ncbi:MAG: hypothetical protein APR63_06805 [Desulfuromonas sp. SDB]|nr:MAG: hypothetical protein APR63_06805 [Desulfuromonas sp. SDB]
MKILITGGDGHLAKQISSLLHGYQVASPGKQQLDITEPRSVEKWAQQFKPELIIHSAAITDVNYCEQNPEQAFLVNTYGTINLVNHNPHSRFIFISTDYVFDGEKDSPYHEYDLTNPLSVYGKSKLAAENFIQSRSRAYIIIRTSWLFNSAADFLTKIAGKIRLGKTIEIIGNQWGNPTMNWDLAEAVLNLVDCTYTGTVNITNTGTTTWFDIARYYIDQKNIKNVELVNISIDDYPHQAPRPKYSALSSNLFKHIFKYKLPDWKTSILKHKEFNID